MVVWPALIAYGLACTLAETFSTRFEIFVENTSDFKEQCVDRPVAGYLFSFLDGVLLNYNLIYSDIYQIFYC